MLTFLWDQENAKLQHERIELLLERDSMKLAILGFFAIGISMMKPLSLTTPKKYPRRDFIHAAATAGMGLALGRAAIANSLSVAKNLELGIDNFAVRAMNWKADELIDYAAKLKVDSLFITDLYAFENFEEAYLIGLRKKAEDEGVQLYVGTWSICPTAVRYKNDWGNADEHLALGIRVAKLLGSPVIRVILGGREDRLTEGGIHRKIDDTVKVLKRGKNRAVDSNVKVAMENHAGDMHSLELVRLIEEAGKDFVGANLDSGNAVWTLEDPIENLRNLGPYTLTTSLRDSAVWKSDKGVTAQWTAMGEGMVDWKEYFTLFSKLCPNAPVNIETISGFNRELPLSGAEFDKAWPAGQPKGVDRFLAWAASGVARDAWRRPQGRRCEKARTGTSTRGAGTEYRLLQKDRSGSPRLKDTDPRRRFDLASSRSPYTDENSDCYAGQPQFKERESENRCALGKLLAGVSIRCRCARVDWRPAIGRPPDRASCRQVRQVDSRFQVTFSQPPSHPHPDRNGRLQGGACNDISKVSCRRRSHRRIATACRCGSTVAISKKDQRHTAVRDFSTESDGSTENVF